MIKFKNIQNGFTLIELLISISILSLLLFTGSYSYSMLSERWHKELGQFSKTFKSAKHLENFQRLLEGIHSFVVVDKNKEPAFLFVGGQDSLLAVSRASFYGDDYPEVFRLSSLPQENGLVDLVYQSTSTKNILLLETEQNIEFSKTQVIFEGIDNIKFNYFGWNHSLDKYKETQNKVTPQWFSTYSGLDKQLMPQQILVTLTIKGESLSFPIHLEKRPERWFRHYREDNDE